MPPRPSAASAEPISHLEAHIGYWLRFVSNHVSARFRRLVEAEGVTVSEWVALRHLHDDPTITAAALVTTLGMTKGAVSKLLARLEARGLATRSAHPDDGRAQTLQLTRRGRALVPRLAALADENDAHFFAHLSTDARAALVTTLRDLVREHHLAEVPVD